MAVLVTGGAGYIGSHTAKALAKTGVQPVVLDNLSRGHRESVRWGPLVEADLADRAALGSVFRQYPIEAGVDPQVRVLEESGAVFWLDEAVRELLDE